MRRAQPKLYELKHTVEQPCPACDATLRERLRRERRKAMFRTVGTTLDGLTALVMVIASWTEFVAGHHGWGIALAAFAFVFIAMTTYDLNRWLNERANR